MTAKDELAALKREVELKAKLAPPKPFVPEPYQKYDPTAGMSMPMSTMLEMARAVPDHVIREIALRDNRAPTGRPGMIPTSQQSSGGGPANVPGSGTGWAHETPIGPPPGVAQAERLMDAQDARDRAELIKRDAQLRAMEKLAEGKS
jgi:hypothetical protein